MNRINRMLTITGLGLFAGITIGAAPAMASTNTGQGAVKSSNATTAAKPGERVEDYFDSRDECRVAGQIGDRLGRWDDWDCVLDRDGFHHGDWALVVDQNNWDHGHDWDHGHGWHGHSWHGHGWHGHGWHGHDLHGHDLHGHLPHGHGPHMGAQY